MDHPVVLFDGVCNFCNGSVNFILRQDRKGIFRFAALQSEAGQEILDQHGLANESFDSFILVEKGKIYQRSTAALKVFNKLSWYWKWTQLFYIIPPFIRNMVYDFIARNRYKWFGQKTECMIPSPEMKAKFLE